MFPIRHSGASRYPLPPSRGKYVWSWPIEIGPTGYVDINHFLVGANSFALDAVPVSLHGACLQRHDDTGLMQSFPTA
jgi:hypothetical protein